MLNARRSLIAGYAAAWLCGAALMFAPECGAQDAPGGDRAVPVANVPRAAMVEVEAQFVRATAAQMQEALGTRQPLEPRSVLSPEQLKKAVASLERTKASFFGRPRAVTVSGQRAIVEAVRELRYPTEF